MADSFDLAAVARLIGEPARAAMLARLLDGTAVTPGELAREAGISAQTASGHLSKLLAGGIVEVVAQGRHRYYRLAGADVAGVLEALSVLPLAASRPSRVPEGLRFARTCYNHLAGRLGVAIKDAFIRRGFIAQASDVFTVTEQGRAYFESLGGPTEGARALQLRGRACMDWSERRPHLAGVLGSFLFEHLLARRWIARTKVPRALRLTVEGRRELEGRLGLRFDRD